MGEETLTEIQEMRLSLVVSLIDAAAGRDDVSIDEVIEAAVLLEEYIMEPDVTAGQVFYHYGIVDE